MDDAAEERGAQASPFLARELEAEVTQCLALLVAWWDAFLDQRLARTRVASIVALVE